MKEILTYYLRFTILLSYFLPQLLANDNYTLKDLEDRVLKIDHILDNLAHPTIRSGVGNLGWFSKLSDKPSKLEWAEISLQKNILIDQVVLTPVIRRNTNEGVLSDGFPKEFTIIAKNSITNKETVISEYKFQEQSLERITPFVITFEPIFATSVRIEAKPVICNGWNNLYGIQLSEVLIFSGDKNVALRKPVRVSSKATNKVNDAFTPKALVDGSMPYLMDARSSKGSKPFITFYKKNFHCSYLLDLGESLELDEIHLHAADIRENVPRIHHADYGIPFQFRLEGANKEDFSDAKLLTEFNRDSIYQTSSIVMLNFPSKKARYIRFTSLKGYKAPEASGSWNCFGFAEIEIFSNGVNKALGKIINTTSSITKKKGHEDIKQGVVEHLTDGKNHYGSIIPLKSWLSQLSQRYDLEKEKSLLSEKLSLRYSQQNERIKILKVVIFILTVAVILIILVSRLIRMRKMTQLQERLSADLHDELGANLHAIGLISDVAQDAESPEEWKHLSQRIRNLTERSGLAVRHCINMMEAKDLQIGLVSSMRRSAERITTNLKHQLSIEGEEYLTNIKSQLQVDIHLFYKECLMNICRHSDASEVKSTIVANKNEMILCVLDNGTGLPSNMKNKAPKSLQRRANLLKGKLTIQNSSIGTKITLVTPLR